jgi:quercetin dioxygenase-like cupin family protein
VARGQRYPGPYTRGVGYRVVRRDEPEWKTRPSDPGEPRRHTADLTELAGFRHTRANFWRYEPGAKGRRHREPEQDETFVVLRGTLTMYLGDPPERQQVGEGGLIHVEAGTELQTVNETDEELLLFVCGAPAGSGQRAEILDSAV